MLAVDDSGSQFASTLTDLRQTPLAQVPTQHADAVQEAVSRILPDQSANRVPVAAFNSSI